MKSVKIKTAARKALIAANSHYYSWTPQQQEHFRASMDEDAENRVDAILLNELLGISCTPANARDIWRDLPLVKRNHLNWGKLLTTGIGDDMISLNEIMDEGKSLLDFNTLYDYDFDNYLFQEQEYKKEDKNYPGRDYYALRFSCWVRLITNDQFYYATLYSLAGYLIEQLEDKSHDIIQKLIPHDYVEGKNHGKPEKGGFLWDMQLDADGLEKHLHELMDRWHHYTEQLWLDLSKTAIRSIHAVFTADIEQDGELHRNFIFSNDTALKQVRWQHFLVDCERLTADYAEVADREKQELAKAESWLRETHEDIMRHFDPDVIKLRKKMKIVVAPGALDGLVDKDNDE